jgi:hypothetical protein
MLTYWVDAFDFSLRSIVTYRFYFSLKRTSQGANNTLFLSNSLSQGASTQNRAGIPTFGGAIALGTRNEKDSSRYELYDSKDQGFGSIWYGYSLDEGSGIVLDEEVVMAKSSSSPLSKWLCTEISRISTFFLLHGRSIVHSIATNTNNITFLITADHAQHANDAPPSFSPT